MTPSTRPGLKATITPQRADSILLVFTSDSGNTCPLAATVDQQWKIRNVRTVFDLDGAKLVRSARCTAAASAVQAITEYGAARDNTFARVAGRPAE